MNSQITLKKGQVKTFVNETGDTLIAMRLDDARTILTDVLNYQIADSLVKEYEAKDKERGKIRFLSYLFLSLIYLYLLVRHLFLHKLFHQQYL